MNEILAAAFGIASNQIAHALNELGDAYKKMKKAGLPLTIDDKRKFDYYMNKINELWRYVNDIEFTEMLNRIRAEREQEGDV